MYIIFAVDRHMDRGSEREKRKRKRKRKKRREKQQQTSIANTLTDKKKEKNRIELSRNVRLLLLEETLHHPPNTLSLS